jgi:nitrate reductase (NAD(P)H)
MPGCVGGRTVKWLSKIILSGSESENFYHLHDNCVFPPHVRSTALMSQTVAEGNAKYEQAQRDATAARNPFILYQLNINSAILTPAHGQTIKVHSNLDEHVDFQGYAYDGGGRKITRVEVTLDDGETWRQCCVVYPKDYAPEKGSRWYVMCTWRFSIAIWEMASAKSISVRAWNQSANTQPEKHTWNILGMMNNAWYKVHINRSAADVIQVLHPVCMAPCEPKGWMEQLYPITRYDERYVPPIVYSREEIRQHNSVSGCWVVIDTKVYDLTDFLNLHPGGPASIVAHAGGDVTKLFYDIHSEDTQVLKAAYVIGSVAQDDEPQEAASQEEQSARHRHPNTLIQRRHPRVTPDGKQIGLSSSQWVDVTLKEKTEMTHDTRRFTFALSSADQRMWLPWGKHINIGVELEDRMVVRPYTPVKPILAKEDNGTFELVVKIYFPTDARPGGEMTQILEKLQIGEAVKIKGPEGVIWYMGNCHYAVHGHFFFCDKMNFIVGGTGITPALAVIRAILLAEKRTDVDITLVFANRTPDDILCEAELEELVKSSNRLRICHVIASGTPAVEQVTNHPHVAYASGHVSTAILRDNIIAADEQSCCFLCGPPAMLAHAVIPALMELGFDQDQVLEF